MKGMDKQCLSVAKCIYTAKYRRVAQQLEGAVKDFSDSSVQ